MDGSFGLPLEVLPTEALELILTATQVREDGTLSLAIFDGDGVAVPTDRTKDVEVERLWAWVAAPLPGSAFDFGVVHIDEDHGAGALALVQGLARLRRRAERLFGEAGGGASEAPLAVVWSPARTPSCLSCYLPESWGSVVWRSAGGDVAFERAIFLSGASATPSHFTPSLYAHELGHWVMDVYSRRPDAGGPHGWVELTPPPLAWSEGFATFFAQWALSGSVLDEARFFSVQSDIEYWVDLEAVGSAAREDASSFAAVFPMPEARGTMAQWLNETVVAAILWDLWDEARDEPVALGDEALLAIASSRMTAGGALDRGVPEPDLVDYLDALACTPFRRVDLRPALMSFPWDGDARCR